MNSIDIKEWELEITQNCNLACPLCARTDQKYPLWNNPEISLHDFKKLVTPEMIKGSEFKLCGTRGDPIAHTHCLEICQYLQEHGARKVSLSTNGGYNNVAWWEALAKTNARPNFALDGGPETLHMYRINVKWETVDRNLRAFINAGGWASAQFIIFNHNEHEFKWIVDYCKELGIGLTKRTSGRNIFEAGKTATTRKGEKITYSEGTTLKHTDLASVKQAVDRLDKLQIQAKLESYEIQHSTATPEEKLHRMLKALTIKNASSDENIKQTIASIKCKHLKTPELFLCPEGRVWPCCFLYDNHMNKGKYIDKLYGSTFNSLHQHSLQEILDNDYFQTIADRWNPLDDNFELRCVKTCGNNAAYMNKREKIV